MSVSTFAEHMTTCVRSVEKALPRPKQLVLTSKSPQDMAIIANRWQRRDRRKWTDKYRGKDRNVKKDASMLREWVPRAIAEMIFVYIFRLTHKSRDSFQYQCSYCPKRFPHVSLLKIHERVHTGEKPFQCKDCGQCFGSQSSLIKHNRWNLCGWSISIA